MAHDVDERGQPVTSSRRIAHAERRQAERRREAPHGRAVREDSDQRECEPVARSGIDRRRENRQDRIDCAPSAGGLNRPDRDAHDEREEERREPKAEGDRERFAEDLRHGPSLREALAEVAPQQSSHPSCILNDDRRIECELGAKSSGVLGRCRRWNENGGRVARCQPHEHEGERDDQPDENERSRQPAREGMHTGMMPRGRLASTSRVLLAPIVMATLLACGGSARGTDTVVYASGADLESANPLVTVHPLSRQIQRFALFVTLARYDSALAPQPYFAHAWDWNGERDELTLRLHTGLSWHDGKPTTARDVAFTVEAARDRVTGYLRYADLATVASVAAPDDSTVVIRFTTPPPGFPTVLCELPVLPSHLLANVPR